MMACREVGLCRRGHLLDEANRYVRPTGVVSCRTCNREDVMASRKRGKPKPKPMCECGRGRIEVKCGRSGGPKLAGCSECNAIDGTSPAQRDIVQALRIAGQELTTNEVAADAGAAPKSAMVTLRRLEERGIVVSRLGPYPGETAKRFGRPYGRWAEREMGGGRPQVRYWRIAGRRS
jgi:hypothetical protein